MKKTFIQVFFLTLIPLVCLMIVLNAFPEGTVEDFTALWYFVGAYIIMGGLLLLTKFKQMGKSLVISGIVILLGAFLWFAVVFGLLHGGYGVH